MARARKRSRLILTTVAVLVLAAALTAAFWPQPTPVDIGSVTRGPMQVTIDEEGRTKVREIYVVSAPVDGQLQRVQVHAGDKVTARESVVATMRPTNPAALDIRTREQAKAAVEAAKAALRVALADRNAAAAQNELAYNDLDRIKKLAASGTASQAALQRAEAQARATEAALQTAEASIAMRQAELTNAQARLIGFDDPALAREYENNPADDIPLHAPIDGRILRVLHESAAVIPAGTPILEIGNTDTDLEVVVDLISSDAVQVSVGDPVLIEDWGGPHTLLGEVAHIAPSAETKVSALGVEEQRVEVTIRFTEPPEAHDGLGHGFRVLTRIVVWKADDALKLPSAALFREKGQWAVFVIDAEDRAHLQPVEIGHNNGVEAEVLSGLSEGDRVVLYPTAGFADGTPVAPRSGG